MHEYPFYWAVGIENTFIPHEAPGLRPLEQYELMQHYDLWRQDFDSVASLGISHIRWGIPWYRVNPAPGAFDWSWTDEVIPYLVQEKRLTPIIDLVHYGTPLWLEGAFFNEDYPHWVAEYARAFAERYRDLVDHYTPLNEPNVNAEYCGRRGEWPPYGKGDEGYVAVIMSLVRGMILTTRAVRNVDPEATFVQVEALGHAWTNDPEVRPAVEQWSLQNYLAFDLFSGLVDTAHPLWPFLRANNVSENDLRWFKENAETVDILGVNIYPWSGGEMAQTRDGRLERRQFLTGHYLKVVLEEAWQRYGLPLMVTETSALGDITSRAVWMDETVQAVRAARAAGIAVLGYTWFPAFTMVDWEYRCGVAPMTEYLIHLGLWEVQPGEGNVLWRQPTPLVERYHTYVSAGAP